MKAFLATPMHRSIIRGAAIILFAGLVSSCAGTPQVRATNSLAILCSSYAVLLGNLTPHKAGMSAGTVKRIDSTNALVKPACKEDSTVNPAEAVATVQSGLELLRTVRETL